MASQLDLYITIGHDLTAIKYYALATCTILFYDHLLTLADEVSQIKYAWSGKKSWMFWLFITNRYFPMMYHFWLLRLSYAPSFSTKVCDKTAFFPILSFVVCTLLAQVVLTIGIYAVTRKNIPIAIGFAVITACQLALGICLVTLTAKKGGQPLPPFPFDAYHLCVFIRHRSFEIAYTGISLFYDSLAFTLIVYLAVKSKASKLKVPSILRTIAEDAMRYFLVMFTSHFVFEMTLTLGRESIQLLPAAGNVVYLPVMISRSMLSLKKATDSQRRGRSLTGPSTNAKNVQSMRFFHSRKATTAGEDGILLDTYNG